MKASNYVLKLGQCKLNSSSYLKDVNTFKKKFLIVSSMVSPTVFPGFFSIPDNSSANPTCLPWGKHTNNFPGGKKQY